MTDEAVATSTRRTRARTRSHAYARTGPTAGQAARRFTALVLGSLILLVVAGTGGLAVGSHSVPLDVVVDALTGYDRSNTEHLIVVSSRLPRTVLGVLVGAALGLSGALMQAVTRNPLAEPGLLGVNAGAAFAVVIGIAHLGVVTIAGYLPLALLGAAIAAVGVYLLGSAHRSKATPVRMALSGAAIAIVVTAMTRSILLSNERAFNDFRFWAVGSLQGRSFDIILTVLPLVGIGILLAVVLGPALNAVALGEQTSRALGARPALIRAGAAVAVVLLAGAATAAAGPIGFVGLAAPHLVRSIVGSDQRLLLPATLVVAPAFLVTADVLGRWAAAPAELQTGISAAILGGPVFVALVRSRRMAAL